MSRTMAWGFQEPASIWDDVPDNRAARGRKMLHNLTAPEHIGSDTTAHILSWGGLNAAEPDYVKVAHISNCGWVDILTGRVERSGDYLDIGTLNPSEWKRLQKEYAERFPDAIRPEEV